MDLYVIIEIGDDENVTIITAYPEKRRGENMKENINDSFEVDYRYEDGKNVVTIKKNIADRS